MSSRAWVCMEAMCSFMGGALDSGEGGLGQGFDSGCESWIAAAGKGG